MTKSLNVFLLLVVGCGLPASRAQEQAPAIGACLLRLRTVNESAVPLSGVPVELVDAEGRIVFATQSQDGEAEICDFDFGTYSVRVWRGACLPTTVSNIRFKPGEPMRLTIMVNTCTPRPDHRTACGVYVRVRTPDGRPIQRVEVWQNGRDWKVLGDQFGRAVFPVKRAATTAVLVGAPGYRTEALRLSCIDVEDIERRIVLQVEP